MRKRLFTALVALRLFAARRPPDVGEEPTVVAVLLDTHAPLTGGLIAADDLVHAVYDGEVQVARAVADAEALVGRDLVGVIVERNTEDEDHVVFGDRESPSLREADARVLVVECRAGRFRAPVLQIDEATRATALGRVGCGWRDTAHADSARDLGYSLVQVDVAFVIFGEDLLARRDDVVGAAVRLSVELGSAAHVDVRGYRVVVVIAIVACDEPGDEAGTQDKEQERSQDAADDCRYVAAAPVIPVIAVAVVAVSSIAASTTATGRGICGRLVADRSEFVPALHLRLVGGFCLALILHAADRALGVIGVVIRVLPILRVRLERVEVDTDCVVDVQNSL